MKKKIFILLFFIINFIFVFQAKAGIEKSINYLKQQSPNEWITMALVSANEKNLSYDYLKKSSSSSATDYEKKILAITSLGFDPKNFTNQDFVKKLTDQYKNGQIGSTDLLNDDFWGILALAAAGEDMKTEIIENSKKFILAHQNKDGGFGYAIGVDSDTNDTSAAIMALLETGMNKYSSEIFKAEIYLKNTQNNDAGFPFQKGSFSDGASSAWVVSAIYKLGEDPKFWQKQGKNPLDFLWSLQQSDGSFLWQKTNLKGSPLVTAYAVIALNGISYPIKKISQNNIIEKKEETKKEEKKDETKKNEPIEPVKKETDKEIIIKNNNKDSDSDGLPDKKEKYYKTNPKKWDTDGDGWSDGVEVAQNYDPLSPAPCPIKKFSKNGKKFAYGKRRLSPVNREECYSKYLKGKLKKQFSQKTLKKINFSKILNAFIYGGYSVKDIIKAIRFNGKTVHPIFPKSIWQKSLDYQIYINK